jgi:transcriptional regulator with XRE-family HTH domain
MTKSSSPKVLALLKSYGIRQADLAQRLGVRKSTVSMWFRGKSKIPAYCRDDLWALATLAREAIEAGGEGRGALATWTLSHDRQCPLPQSVGDVERHYLTRGVEILQRHAPPDCTTLVLNATTLEDLRQGVGMVLQGISAIQVRWAQMPLPLSERESKVVTSCGGK